MREIVRQGAPVAPLPLPDLCAEALQIARLLRLGHDDPALERLGAFTSRIGASLGGLAPELVQKVLKALQELSLCQARMDPIGMADVLEHQVARYLTPA